MWCIVVIIHNVVIMEVGRLGLVLGIGFAAMEMKCGCMVNILTFRMGAK